MMKEYDLLITGCGLSSIFGAMEAASHGLNVLMIEKSIDISYPPSGPMFVSSQTHDRYFSKYEKYVYGKFGTFTLKTDDFENDYLIEKGSEIVSIDREKLIRHMCSDLAQNGVDIRIKSYLEHINEISSGFQVKAVIEGRSEEFLCKMIAFGDGNLKSEYIVHQKGCNFHSYNSSYSRSISPRTLDSKFAVYVQNDGKYTVEAHRGKLREVLAIGVSAEDHRGTVSHFDYIGQLHSCFPSTRRGMALLGNMMGSTRVLGTPVRDIIELSLESIRYLLDEEGDKKDNMLLEKWKDTEGSWNNQDLDPVDYIKEKIPIGL